MALPSAPGLRKRGRILASITLLVAFLPFFRTVIKNIALLSRSEVTALYLSRSIAQISFFPFVTYAVGWGREAREC
eukprot:1362861-Amorphochlora_amoeboformis.AAC.1